MCASINGSRGVRAPLGTTACGDHSEAGCKGLGDSQCPSPHPLGLQVGKQAWGWERLITTGDHWAGHTGTSPLLILEGTSREGRSGVPQARALSGPEGAGFRGVLWDLE